MMTLSPLEFAVWVVIPAIVTLVAGLAIGWATRGRV